MTWAFPAPEDDGGARHLVPGTPLPDVTLVASSGAAVNIGCLDGLAVLFVYPWTGRPGLSNPPGWDDVPGAHGSTPEAEGFRDLHGAFAEVPARIFGTSGQDTAWQREFAARLQLPYELLSDAEGQLRDALKLPTFQAGGAVYLTRLTLVLRDSAIMRTFYPVHPPDAHPRAVLDWLSVHGGSEN